LGLKPRFKYEIEPMDLANIRQNGVRSLVVMCFGCRHEVIIDVDQFPGDLLVRFAPCFVCRKAAGAARMSGRIAKSGRRDKTGAMAKLTDNQRAVLQMLTASRRRYSLAAERAASHLKCCRT
jgi:hypothetical protein